MFIQSHDINTCHLCPAHHIRYMQWQQLTLCVDQYLQADQTLYLITLALARGITPWAYYPPHAAHACWNIGHNGPRGDSISIQASSLWTPPYIALDKQHLWPFIFVGALSAMMAFVHNSQSTQGCPLSPVRHVTSFFVHCLFMCISLLTLSLHHDVPIMSYSTSYDWPVC